MRLSMLAALAAVSFAAASIAVAADAASAPDTAGAPVATVPAAGPLAAVPVDQAQIVFLDPSNAIANAFAPAVYDVTPGESRAFLAKLGAHVNAAAFVAPGHHLLMVRTLAVTQFLDTTVEAGHRYYVLVRFVYGHGFQLRPLRPSVSSGTSEYSTGNPKFKEWLSDAAWPAHTDEYPQGSDPAKFAARLDEHQAAGLAEWNAKTPDQKAELTLTVADAVDH